MISTSDFKNGLCVEFKSGLYQIVEFQHVKPGKGPAFVRTKLRNLDTGRVIDNTFQSGVKLKSVRIEYRPYQYLYRDDMGLNFMHLETFEQITLQEEMVENADLMKEGQELQIMFHADKEMPMSCLMPAFVDLEVEYTEPGLKGDTATNTLKPATLETKAEIMVPIFINIGDKIRVDTRTRGYSERIK